MEVAFNMFRTLYSKAIKAINEKPLTNFPLHLAGDYSQHNKQNFTRVLKNLRTTTYVDIYPQVVV